MRIIKPNYYDSFRCIADRCPDSCCKEWDVQVVPESAAYYRSLPGALGDRLRQALQEEDGETVMTIEDGRCPMWQEDGLCRIQAELGEAALCHTCRQFPRLTHDYGSFQEWGLELSCPEAARIILENPDPVMVCQTLPGNSSPDYDPTAMEELLMSREIMYSIIREKDFSIPEMLAMALIYGYQVQAALDGEENGLPDDVQSLETARKIAQPGSMQEILDFFKTLEILTPQWEELLAAPTPTVWDDTADRAIARYFVDRYWLQAVSDYDILSRIRLMVVSCLVIHTVGQDICRTAQLYSKEIENSIENLEALLDATWTHPAFHDNILFGLLLNK